MSDRNFRIDPDPKDMKPSPGTDASAFTGLDHTELNHRHYTSPDETVLAGTWQCAPCREVIESYPVNEMMTVVSGAITLTHRDGRSESFGPGDTFYIAKGQYVVWEITQTLRKMYMIVS